MNNCVFAGKLGKDPEIKFSADGKMMVKFSIAVYHKKDKTDWVNCVAFDKVAEQLSKLRKGKLVTVQGAYHDNDYTNKDGVKIRSKELTVFSQSYDYAGMERTTKKEGAAGDMYTDSGFSDAPIDPTDPGF
jgi:single-strand DNA-binding protein